MLLRPFLCVMILCVWVGSGQAATPDDALQDAEPKKTVVIATETARGEWENGIFTPLKPEFRFRFEIDEERATAKLTEMTRLKNDTVIDQPVEYIIASVDEGNGLNILLITEARRNQRVLTLIGKPGALATEVILLGENFFEYSKAASGRLYLSTGTIKRPVSVGDDAVRQLRDAREKRQKKVR